MKTYRVNFDNGTASYVKAEYIEANGEFVFLWEGQEVKAVFSSHFVRSIILES